MTLEFQAGQQLGSYKLDKRLGAGAFAEVWLALEGGALGFKKKIALKVLKTGAKEGDPHFASLINEVRVCGHMHHPHLVDMLASPRWAGSGSSPWSTSKACPSTC